MQTPEAMWGQRPKGWVISRNKTDARWRMSHYYYTDLTLTMLDADALPVGRHKWLVENNVCNEGLTSPEELLISGCDDTQFTCDDGKCLDISQRCNNVEVFISNPFYLNIIWNDLQDCDDVSDEKNCRTIHVDPEKYLKSKPPPSAKTDSKLPVELRYINNIKRNHC